MFLNIQYDLLLLEVDTQNKVFIVKFFFSFAENVGVGEREARVASELVAQRHFRYVLASIPASFPASHTPSPPSLTSWVCERLGTRVII